MTDTLVAADGDRYEAERLDATAAWVSRHRPPGSGALAELGAREGALTVRLLKAGYTVHAAEPDPALRARLFAALRGRARLRLTAGDLADPPPVRRRFGAVLLIDSLHPGQDLELLHALPTDLLFVALAPSALDGRLRPWLSAQQGWLLVEEVDLAAPHPGPCPAAPGSRGVLLRRAC
ncbi:hypothetical protein [Streptomyces sp. TLI_171]|uniref:hypothetical protein n=1 Tax=Streptomyces sp. TLI_171 TaxID=1938859 RepID=UPI000C1880C9|nr:hypothetical protein [Streptomyces sp. TLI_171]RKE17962.1 hypothetical protein BX266_1233 [Streptomyces sp. TLI_171]